MYFVDGVWFGGVVTWVGVAVVAGGRAPFQSAEEVAEEPKTAEVASAGSRLMAEEAVEAPATGAAVAEGSRRPSYPAL